MASPLYVNFIYLVHETVFKPFNTTCINDMLLRSTLMHDSIHTSKFAPLLN